MSILQTNFESDFVVNATAAERPTVNSNYLNEFYTVYVDNILIYTSGLLRDYKAKVYIILGKSLEIKSIFNVNKY